LAHTTVCTQRNAYTNAYATKTALTKRTTNFTNGMTLDEFNNIMTLRYNDIKHRITPLTTLYQSKHKNNLETETFVNEAYLHIYSKKLYLHAECFDTLLSFFIKYTQNQSYWQGRNTIGKQRLLNHEELKPSLNQIKEDEYKEKDIHEQNRKAQILLVYNKLKPSDKALLELLMSYNWKVTKIAKDTGIKYKTLQYRAAKLKQQITELVN